MDNATTASAAPAAPRAKPAKMRAFVCDPVCTTCGELPSAITIRAEAASVSDRDIKAAIKKLGHGKYTIMTCRFDEMVYQEVKRDTFA